MGIILPVNDGCRIESDSIQWIVMQRISDDWRARTFWQDLAPAARDCVFLGLATRADLKAVKPFVDRLEQSISRMSALAVGLERDDLDADLGSLWRVRAKKINDLPRLHWVLSCYDIESADANHRLTMGTYRRLDYALRQCLLMRLRRSDSFDSLESIADEIEKFVSGTPMALSSAVTHS